VTISTQVRGKKRGRGRGGTNMGKRKKRRKRGRNHESMAKSPFHHIQQRNATTPRSLPASTALFREGRYFGRREKKREGKGEESERTLGSEEGA